MALTKLDILDGFDGDQGLRRLSSGRARDRLSSGERAAPRRGSSRSTRPSAGWQEPTAGARSWAELPAQAIKYVRRIEELVGCPVALLSTSPEREDTILMQNPFEAMKMAELLAGGTSKLGTNG